MTREEFDRGIKLLRRFLKDEGYYTSIYKNYLFRKGRPEEDLFNEFNTTKFTDVDDWKVLFDRINLMVGCNDDWNYQEFNNRIITPGIDKKWREFCVENRL